MPTLEVIDIKQYFFKTKTSFNLSEFEAYKIKQTILEFASPKKYDYLRTKKFVIYQKNKRTRTRQNLKIRRALALLAQNNGELIEYDEKQNVAFAKDTTYIFADRVVSAGELEFHKTKIPGIVNPIVISLSKSLYSKYIELDNKTIYNYYKHQFVFPEWFRKFLKMRALRAFSSMGFNFNTRRYNDTKWTAEDKFKHDFVKGSVDIYKVYFTLARVLDSKLDACGKGFPISGLMYLALDIDGKCDGLHLIDNKGICIKCLEDSNAKLEKALEKINAIPGLKVVKKLFSGTKGWHLHLELDGKREVSELILRDIIHKVNENEQLVDWFDGKEIEGIRTFDLYRIFKIPSTVDSTTGCLVDEKLIRLNLNDHICEPINAMNI